MIGPTRPRRYHWSIALSRPTALLCVVLAWLGAAPFGLSWAQGPAPYRLLSREGTRPLAVTTVGGQDYVAIDDVAAAFGLNTREDRLAGGLTVTAGASTIIITADQPVVSVAGRLVSLSTAPVRQGTRWLLPLDVLTRAIGPALDTRMDVRRASRLIVIGDLRVPRVVARVDATANATRVTIDTSPPAAARVTLDAERLQVAFDADAIDAALPPVPPQEFLQALQPGETPASLRLTAGPRFGVHRATTSQVDANTARLVIELLPAGAEPPGAPPTAPVPAAPAPAPAPLPDLLPLPGGGVRAVVIDPGHGGDEPGTRGAGGALEKDVTLAVARRLRAMIESRLGLRVYLTRDDDRTLALDDRSAYANSQKADLFLSLHANASIRPALQGAEVHSLALADGLQVSGGGGVTLPALGGGTRVVDLIPWESAQARYVEQSATLASLVEQALRGRVPMSPRARQQAPLRVLVGANMPAVLVEMGYLSHADQERMLTSTVGQDQIALALFDAIVQYRAQVDRPPTPPQRPRP